ncbi:progranulin-like isoform X1 [Boleophthalmus pectinirostris]|uniref:progranulin-like isoform X1 n=1 Tax=Boleophthalmus pectinirostris TaxID=150288 RepID=UPI002432A1F1|nr:progranulin-like isoform X1 [Boleophthalmus pectinirostris]
MLEKFVLLGLCGFVSCYITCPGGQMKCNDQATCCLTEQGYRCCPYPDGVCCADLAHCCPSGYQCNLMTQMCERRWESRPMLRTGLEPTDGVPTVVYCDIYYTCPNGYTCCRHPHGGWTCCPYSPARCCLDGYHCCPYGYDCDYTYTHCIRQGVPYPFGSPNLLPLPADKTLTALKPALHGVIRCDSSFYCSKGSSCCKGPTGQWSCCPYPLASCCTDGIHCCQYGYTCDPDSQVCRSGPLTQ